MTASPIQQATATPGRSTGTAPAALARILVALDASEHANKALDEAVRLAGSAKGVVTGIHA